MPRAFPAKWFSFTTTNTSANTYRKSLKGPLQLEKAVEYAGQILDALDAAHQKGIILLEGFFEGVSGGPR